jgi:glyoxalase superfamily protein
MHGRRLCREGSRRNSIDGVFPGGSTVIATAATVAVALCSIAVMELVRSVVVFDAADVNTESAFWAEIFGGHVIEDEAWHSVIDAAGEWRIGVQLVPNHLPPEWPDGIPQQVHLDLHVDDPRAAHDEAIALGARLLAPGPDLDTDEGHQVYADPAGHPFCIGWGHPSRAAIAVFVANRSRTQKPRT